MVGAAHAAEGRTPSDARRDRAAGVPLDPSDSARRAVSEHSAGRATIGSLGLVTAVTAIASYAVIRSGAPVASAVWLLALLPAAIVDLRTRRLPDRLLVGAALTGSMAAVVERAFGSRLDDVGFADLAVAVMGLAAPLLALHLIEPASMGFGDVKVALVLGLAVAPAVAPAGLVGALTALAFAGLVGVGLAGVMRQDSVPFGPALLIGASLAVAVVRGAP